MGSCGSTQTVKPKIPTQIYSTDKTPLLTVNEVKFLSLLFHELCIRNNSKKHLEKSIFLLLVPIPGMLGERIFDRFDKDQDGYLNEEDFLHVMEKFSKSDLSEIFNELFVICDLKQDNALDKQEFIETFYGMILELLDYLINPLQDKKKNYMVLPNFKLDSFANSGSTLGSFTETLKKNMITPEQITQEIFEKYSANGALLSIQEFKLFLSTHSWIYLKIHDCFAVEDWVNETEQKLIVSKSFQPYPSHFQKPVKIFTKGKWVKKTLMLKNNFLLVLKERKDIEQVFLITGCHFQSENCSLSLTYYSQYDERITFQFESELDCRDFFNSLAESNPPKKFKNFYRFEEKIGYGKFSDVFKVGEISTGMLWVAKVIEKKMMNQAEREMIRREISLLQSISHQGVVKIKEVFDSRKKIKIVLEYIEGGDLLGRIKSHTLTENRVKNIVKKLLDILKYLHRLGIIHRDLKPENILIQDQTEDEIKLIDFGLSSYIYPGETKRFKCGTLGYTAPEVFSGKYNIKADIWSVGVITYGCLTGRLPFFSYSNGELVEMTQNNEVVFEESDWAQYSNNGKEFVRRLLNKDPEARPSSEEALNDKWFIEGN